MDSDPSSFHLFPNSIPQQYQDHVVPIADAAAYGLGLPPLVYGLYLLKDRVVQVQSLVRVLAAPDLAHHEPAVLTLAAATMGSLIQDIKGAATSMMFYWEQLNLGRGPSGAAIVPIASGNHSNDNGVVHDDGLLWNGQLGLCHNGIDNVYGGNFSAGAAARKSSPTCQSQTGDGSLCSGNAASTNGGIDGRIIDNFEIIEVDVAGLLAKYSHFCHVCGKGFKRDANLRMHMRAHGDKYKSSAALSKPLTSIEDNNRKFGKKYSCPQEGCRWNRNHPKFQPLKSLVCVKNHYKRSHCPRIYVCRRCRGKRFAVLSDLRTHEKHCGDPSEWRCTCGTTFSRKDKLMGHMSLFVGHAPAANDGRTTGYARTGEAYGWSEKHVRA